MEGFSIAEDRFVNQKVISWQILKKVLTAIREPAPGEQEKGY